MSTARVQAFFLRDTHHGGPADQAQTVAARFVDFVGAAAESIEMAIYDFRLSDEGLAGAVVGALVGAADRGVAVRIAYDAGKPGGGTADTFAGLAADPAPPGTAEWVSQHFAGTAVATKAITAATGQLMHSKYIVRDGAARHRTSAVWTGSTNFTDDAWTRQENNILTISSEILAPAFRRDFEDMWAAGAIGGTGTGEGGTTHSGHAGVEWDFAPGDGPAIDAYLSAAVAAATRRIVIASMVLTSHPLLGALVAALDRGVPVSGIYDSGQMGPIAAEWARFPSSAQVLADWTTVKANLVAKRSARYTPTGVHNFMHNKILITDGHLATGSYNLSANAEANAENQIRITHDPTLIAAYTDYIAAITDTYR